MCWTRWPHHAHSPNYLLAPGNVGVEVVADGAHKASEVLGNVGRQLAERHQRRKGVAVNLRDGKGDGLRAGLWHGTARHGTARAPDAKLRRPTAAAAAAAHLALVGGQVENDIVLLVVGAIEGRLKADAGPRGRQGEYRVAGEAVRNLDLAHLRTVEEACEPLVTLLSLAQGRQGFLAFFLLALRSAAADSRSCSERERSRPLPAGTGEPDAPALVASLLSVCGADARGWVSATPGPAARHSRAKGRLTLASERCCSLVVSCALRRLSWPTGKRGVGVYRGGETQAAHRRLRELIPTSPRAYVRV